MHIVATPFTKGAEGYSWSTNYLQGPVYVYDCLYGDHVFMESPTTGPQTGVGVQGRSYGLNVVCPVCGSTNVSGPRLARVGEKVKVYDGTDRVFVPGLSLFTGQDLDEVKIT